MTVILQSTETEADAVARFVGLLRLEHDALSGRDMASLDSLVQRKNEVADELQALAEKRNAFLSARGLSVGRVGVEAWLADHPTNKAARAAWTKVMSLAEEARELNRLNGELIRIRMQHNALALETLMGASRQPNLYGPDGQSTPQNSRRINDAA